MKFDLTAPCGDCPFRTDLHPYLLVGRVAKILGDPDARGKAHFPADAFCCHKTVDYSRADNGRANGKTQHCAGVAIILIRDNSLNQAMQLAERLLHHDWSMLDLDAPVYPNRRACIEAHKKVSR